MVTVSPATNLPERSYVTVTGSGMPAMLPVHVLECPAGTAISSCDWSGDFPTGTNGAGGLEHVRSVERVIESTDCAAAPGACVINIYKQFDDGSLLATAPLAFAGPTGPSRPPTWTVSPTTGLVDGQAVTVTGDHLLRPDGLEVAQCGPPITRMTSACLPLVEFRIDERGRFHGTITVRAVIVDPDNGTVDCRQSACFLHGVQPSIRLTFAA